MIFGVSSPDSTKARRGSSRAVGLGLAILLLGATVGVVGSSCAEPEASFYVAYPVESKATCDDTGFLVTCSTTPADSAWVWTCRDCQGNLLRSDFACFEVRSELASTASAQHNERRTIVLQSVDATLSPGGQSLKGHFPVAGAVEPSAAGNPSQAQVVIPLVGAANDAALYSTGISTSSEIIVYGRTTGNLDLQTPPYTFVTKVFEIDQMCM